MTFKFPGDPRKLRERSKMKLWKSFLTRALRPVLSVLPLADRLSLAQNTAATSP